MGRVLLEGKYRSRKKVSSSSWAELDFLPAGVVIITTGVGQRVALSYAVEGEEYYKKHGDSTDYVHLEHDTIGTKSFGFERTSASLTLRAARVFAVDAECQYLLTPNNDAPVLLFDKVN